MTTNVKNEYEKKPGQGQQQTPGRTQEKTDQKKVTR
jgi:hypothetical protein